MDDDVIFREIMKLVPYAEEKAPQCSLRRMVFMQIQQDCVACWINFPATLRNHFTELGCIHEACAYERFCGKRRRCYLYADGRRRFTIGKHAAFRNMITVESEHKGCRTWEETLELAERVPVEEVRHRAAATDKHDVCNMQYTSGTTGFPTGVMLTHYNVVHNGKAIGDCMDLSTAIK